MEHRRRKKKWRCRTRENFIQNGETAAMDSLERIPSRRWNRKNMAVVSFTGLINMVNDG